MNRFCHFQRFPEISQKVRDQLLLCKTVLCLAGWHLCCLDEWLVCDIMITFRFCVLGWSSCFQILIWTKTWFKAAKVHLLFTDGPNNEQLYYRKPDVIWSLWEHVIKCVLLSSWTVFFEWICFCTYLAICSCNTAFLWICSSLYHPRAFWLAASRQGCVTSAG